MIGVLNFILRKRAKRTKIKVLRHVSNQPLVIATCEISTRDGVLTTAHGNADAIFCRCSCWLIPTCPCLFVVVGTGRYVDVIGGIGGETKPSRVGAARERRIRA